MADAQVLLTRKMDDLGRVVVPKEARRYLGWREGTPIDVILDEDNNRIVLEVNSPFCKFCMNTGDEAKLVPVKDGHICSVCLEEADKNKEE